MYDTKHSGLAFYWLSIDYRLCTSVLSFVLFYFNLVNCIRCLHCPLLGKYVHRSHHHHTLHPHTGRRVLFVDLIFKFFTVHKGICLSHWREFFVGVYVTIPWPRDSKVVTVRLEEVGL